MRILEEIGLTFDDVLLRPAHSDILPKQANLQTTITRTLSLNIPLLSAAMDTVTETKLAIALAQEGGIGIVHKNCSIKRQADMVRAVKKHESGVVTNPFSITPDTTIAEVLKLKKKHRVSGFPVLAGKQLVGIVTERDIRFEKATDRPVSEVMTTQEHLVTLPKNATHEDAMEKLRKHRIEKVLLVDNANELCGLITLKDIQTSQNYPHACKDSDGHLVAGAAVGVAADSHTRIETLIDAGVDLLVVDTAHGHSQRVLDQTRWVKQHYPNVQVISGNIATEQAAKDLIEAGADGLKVGIGPGSICTTRVVAGVGVPQITAIQHVSQAAHASGVPVVADGGIRSSGDIVKAIAAGADAIMIGNLFAGTEEAPGETELYQGRTYKSYSGMGSIGAMQRGSSDRYFQDDENEKHKLVPEGIEGRVPYRGALSSMVFQLLGGLRSGMGYCGCADIATMQQQSEMIRITNAGVRESHVHDVTVVKESPNYQITS